MSFFAIYKEYYRKPPDTSIDYLSCIKWIMHITYKQKIRTLHQSVKSSDYSVLVGRGGFEPPKSLTADLQSAPFGHSGTYPYKKNWSWWTDSNPRPADYKSAALPTELHQLI